MRCVIALILVAACNQVYSLDKTTSQDAAVFVAPHCPPLGAGPPIFAEQIQQAVRSIACGNYTVAPSANRALGVCRNFGFATLVEGEILAPLMPMTVEPAFTGAQINYAVLAPEGDQMLVQQFFQQTTEASLYERGADNVWHPVAKLPTTTQLLSTPTRRPNRRYLAATIGATTHALAEYVEDDAGKWSKSPTPHEYTDLVALPFDITMLSLSPDGLRLVGATNGKRVFYTDRDRVEDRFRPSVALEAAPSVTDPFMTEDCARLCFSNIDLRSIFYLDLVPLTE